MKFEHEHRDRFFKERTTSQFLPINSVQKCTERQGCCDTKHLNSQQMKTGNRRREGAPLDPSPPLSFFIPLFAPSVMQAGGQHRDNNREGGVLH